jgi:hypothetical protein
MTSTTTDKGIEYVNYTFGFKAVVPEHLYKEQTQTPKGVAFGRNPIVFIGSFPEYSIDNLYGYAIQQLRNQGLTIRRDEYVYLRDLLARNCIFETRSMYSHAYYIQGRRSVYTIACFIRRDQLTADGFGVIMMVYNMIVLPTILNSFEELPYSNMGAATNLYSDTQYEDGPGTLMAKRGLIDIGVGW